MNDVLTPIFLRRFRARVLTTACLLGLATHAALVSAGGISDPWEMVMTDEQCLMMSGHLGRDRRMETAKGSRVISICARSGNAVTCRQQTLERSDHLHSAESRYVITEERSPKMVMMSEDSLTLVIVDWSKDEFVLASTWMDRTMGFIQKQCKGVVATREQIGEALHARDRAAPKRECKIFCVRGARRDLERPETHT